MAWLWLEDESSFVAGEPLLLSWFTLSFLLNWADLVHMNVGTRTNARLPSISSLHLHEVIFRWFKILMDV